ncbi:MAG: amidase [bacterium]|nr:amidase [bacterium]MBU1918163.1 amidase [bacterium]
MTTMLGQMPVVLQPGFQTAQLMAAGQMTIEQLHAAHQEQIDRVNPGVNAVIAHNFNTSLHQLLRSSQSTNPSLVESMPLYAVPAAIKACVPVSGFPDTQAGTKKNGAIAERNAPIVQRLFESGALPSMITNLPPRSSSFTTHNSPKGGAGFGTTHNPYNLDHTCYGSSGGVAAAITTGMATLGLGFSIAGSVQLPAHGCGVYALTLSPALASCAGHFPGTETVRHMAVPGLFARHPRDLSLALPSIIGHDNSPHQNRQLALNARQQKKPEDINIGVTSGLGDLIADDDTLKLLEILKERLVKLGYNVHDKHLNSNFAEELWYVSGGLFSAQVGPSMGFMGRLFFKYMSGLKEHASDWAYYKGLLENLSGDSFSNYMALMHRRDGLFNIRDQLLNDYDYIIMPSAISAAPKEPLNAKTVLVNGEEYPVAVGLGAFGTVGNILGVPVASVPIGFSELGLPVGIQMLGKPQDDANLLAVVNHMHENEAVPGWQPAEWVVKRGLRQ